ncbi:MAG: hypothetical protein M1401_19865 [Chloroflexi bacterium]|nr:hypothetical protein [Chloroflexota bacterium]
MAKLEARSAWGILLIAAGLLFLLQSLGIIPAGIGLLWASIFGLGGLAFLYVFLANHDRNWWAVIPSFTLLGIAGTIVLAEISPRAAAPWGGALFLGAIGLSFLVIYLDNRLFWWAIIPAGTLLTLALVAGLGVASRGVEAGGVFFLGLGLTFLALYYAPVTQPRQTRWAIIPAIVLIIMGAFVYVASTQLIAYFWPLILIGLGLWLFLRGRGRPQT